MNKGKITKNRVERLQPDPSGKDVFLWDNELSGFGVRCRPNGRWYYFLKYRAAGRQKWKTLGRHGVITADQAREAAKRILVQKQLGYDPAPKRKTKRISDLCDWYIANGMDHLKNQKSKDGYLRAIEQYIRPVLGAMTVNEVEKQHVKDFHFSMRDKPIQANRVLGTLSILFNSAIDAGFRTKANPCSRVKRNAEKWRVRYLSKDEMGRLDKVLNTDTREYPNVIAAIRLILLTGARQGEIRSLVWGEVKLDESCLRLEDSKTGPKTIHLTQAAVDVIEALPRGKPTERVIAPHTTGRRNLQEPWRRLRKLAGLEDVRLHDLRHHFAVSAVVAGQSLHVIGGLLGHRKAETTQRYAHFQDQVLKDAVDQTAEVITSNWKSKK